MKSIFFTPIRIILTALCFMQFAVQVVWLSKWAMPRIISRFKDPEDQRERALMAAQKHVKIYLKTLSFFRLIQFEFMGKPMSEPGIVAGNHPSLLDFIVLLVDFPQAVCIYKSQAKSNPVLSSFVRVSGYIEGMDGSKESSQKIIQECSDSIETGHKVVFFPEGTRSQSATSLKKFRTTLFHSVIQTNSAVQPVAIYCKPLFLGKNQSWLEFSSGKNLMVISYLPPIYVHNLADSERSARGLASRTQDAIKEELLRLDSL